MANPRKGKEIRAFIIRNVRSHPKDIARVTAKHFQVSRSAVTNHLAALAKEGVLVAKGTTKAREYELKLVIDEVFELPVTPALQEDVIWRERVKPLLDVSHPPQNVLDICNHGFTEMLNNVIDHSESKTVRIHVYVDANSIQLGVVDFGVGIFRKIQKYFNLNDPRHALLELAKGKLTSDKTRHSGEGIFFTSRMFDKYAILSGQLYFTRINTEHDFLIEVENISEFRGTMIRMDISLDANQTTREVFDRYASERDDYGFTRTHIPIKLTKYDDDQLVSRSAAKRLLARFSDFKEVWLDFKGVPSIGQAFADEIFRVFAAGHPDIKIFFTDANETVEKMIHRVSDGRAKLDDAQMDLLKGQ